MTTWFWSQLTLILLICFSLVKAAPDPAYSQDREAYSGSKPVIILPEDNTKPIGSD